MIELTDALLIAGVSGIASAVSTIAALKTDIWWIKKILGQHNKRLIKLEKAI